MTRKEAERALEIARLNLKIAKTQANVDYWTKRVVQATEDLARFERAEK